MTIEDAVADYLDFLKAELFHDESFVVHKDERGRRQRLSFRVNVGYAAPYEPAPYKPAPYKPAPYRPAPYRPAPYQA